MLRTTIEVVADYAVTGVTALATVVLGACGETSSLVASASDGNNETRQSEKSWRIGEGALL